MRQPKSSVLVLAFLVFTTGLIACSADESRSPHDLRTSQSQDLSQLRRSILRDRAYSEVNRKLASEAVSEAEARAGHLTRGELELITAGVVASADNGHTTVWSGPRSGRANRIPVRLILLADGVFVVRAKGPGVSVLGMRVDSIDDMASADVLKQLRIYRGGPDNLRDYDSVSLMESPELLNAAGIAKSDQQLTLTVSDHGQARSILLRALAAAPNERQVKRLRYLAAQHVKNEGADWQSAFQNTPDPLWLQNPDMAFRRVLLPALAAIYLQLKTNTDAESGESIKAFLKTARSAIAQARPQNVIVDVRFDDGGDYTKTAAFMSDLPRLIPTAGRVFVITHAGTFSAGISSVGFVKQAAPRRVIIVGEPVGDRLIFYGEPRNVVLPNSGIVMSYATGLHDYLHGCRWFGPCYWVDWIYPISVATLDPEIPTPLSFALIAAGRDPALEAVADLVQHSAQPQS